MNRKNQKGQAVLIILLSMVVALTVVLSIVASSTADIKISSNESVSQRVFSAAESGIEKALVPGSILSGTVDSGASYNATVTDLVQNGGKSFIYPSNLVSGDAATFWFVSHADDGTLVCNGSDKPCFTGNLVRLCWGKPATGASTPTTPAVEVSLYYLSTPGNYSTVKNSKVIIDPYTSRQSSNSYASSDGTACSINGTNFAFQKTFTLSTVAGFNIPIGVSSIANGLQFLTAKTLYNVDSDQPMAMTVNFAGNSILPSQGRQVDSIGNQGDVTRKIEVSRAYNGVPSVFDSAIFSPNTLSK